MNRQRQPQIAKIIKLRGAIRRFTVTVGAYSRGGLLKVCSSRVGTYSTGLFRGGGAIRRFTVFCIVYYLSFFAKD